MRTTSFFVIALLLLGIIFLKISSVRDLVLVLEAIGLALFLLGGYFSWKNDNKNK